jgi:hypothetical protein
MSFGKLLSLMAPRTSRALVSGECLSKMARIAAQFPLTAVGYFGFETRLQSEDAHSDFAFSLSRDGVEGLAENSSQWAPISSFCRLWNETAPEAEQDGTIWLEFDVDGSATQVPSLFFALLEPEATLLSAGECERSLSWLCGEALPALWQRAIPRSIEGHLARCVEALPATADRIQIGTMLARKVDALRFCGFQVMAEAVLPFLGRIEWPGDLEAVAGILERYAGLAHSFCVHVDIAQAVLPTLGLELLFPPGDPWDWQPLYDSRWQRLFDTLVADGYCLPAKRDALLEWPSRVIHQTPLVEKLIDAAGLHMPGDAPSLPDGVLVMGLQHVKLSLMPGREPTAKAYFGARYDRGIGISP